MIPQRFVTEYPNRCRQLLDMLEPAAREKRLVGSLSLLVGASAFTIPFGRLVEADHPVANSEPELSRAVKRLDRCSFHEAPFWNGSAAPNSFRYAKIVNAPEFAAGWQDATGKHPMQSTEKKDAATVLRTIRRALAHGNIVYLNDAGHEVPGDEVRFIAFLCRHDDGSSFRITILSEEDFLYFLKAWIAWLQTFPPQAALAVLEAAE